MPAAARSRAATIVNAAGPWVADVLNERLETEAESRVRLIKGSHIVVPRLYEGEHAFILQQPDGRVVFALPYGEHNLIGTTDIAVAEPKDAVISAAEIAYLCDAANRYFVRQIAPEEVIWSYAGVRALYDDGAAEAKNVTRDYRLELDDTPGPKLLSIFGGKITTARASGGRGAGEARRHDGAASPAPPRFPAATSTPPSTTGWSRSRPGCRPKWCCA